MGKKLVIFVALAVSFVGAAGQAKGEYPAKYAREPRFAVLVYYTPHAEVAHVDFAKQGIEFFRRLNYGEGFRMDVATELPDAEVLKRYSVVVALNTSPQSPAERTAFESYMNGGGGWVGFHAAGYNDRNTGWPWLVDFLGGGVFLCNNWPPQPVLLKIDNSNHAVTKNLPAQFVAPESEWYQFEPSPRENPDVEVLASMAPENYPLGIKDVVRWGDWPVMWTNTKYRMVYLNCGHNEKGFDDPTQNLLIINAFRWVVSRDGGGNPFER